VVVENLAGLFVRNLFTPNALCKRVHCPHIAFFAAFRRVCLPTKGIVCVHEFSAGKCPTFEVFARFKSFTNSHEAWQPIDLAENIGHRRRVRLVQQKACVAAAPFRYRRPGSPIFRLVVCKHLPTGPDAGIHPQNVYHRFQDPTTRKKNGGAT